MKYKADHLFLDLVLNRYIASDLIRESFFSIFDRAMNILVPFVLPETDMSFEQKYFEDTMIPTWIGIFHQSII